MNSANFGPKQTPKTPSKTLGARRIPHFPQRDFGPVSRDPGPRVPSSTSTGDVNDVTLGSSSGFWIGTAKGEEWHLGAQRNATEDFALWASTQRAQCSA